LDRAGVTPNAISLASLAFAIGAALSIWRSGEAAGIARAGLLLVGAALIQMRLLCNMLDGMVAIEGGHRTPLGDIFNDMPDRFADVAILLGAGYALNAYWWGAQLGWLAATLAILTAYVRLLGGSLGAAQSFAGPMAKPQRMAVLTAACVLATFEPLLRWKGQTIAAALAIIVVGCCVTIGVRTARIAAERQAR
jgi:phosphatidylglycerophosphate synthase